jgi:hypothetical protein
MSDAPAYRMRLVGGDGAGHTLRLPCPCLRILVDPEGPPNRFMRRPEMYFLVRIRRGRGVMLAESSLPRLRARQDIRAAVSLLIVAERRHFLVCEGCGAIHPRAAVRSVCPLCNGYRLSTDPADLAAAAEVHSHKPPVWTIPEFDC